MSTFIIAEIGSTWRFGKNNAQHHRNALEAIATAQACGANAIKFQWTSDPRAMEKRRKVKRGSYDILAWPREWLEDFHEACALHKIEFMVTVFLEKDVSVIASYVSRFKVASLESEDHELIACMREFKKEVIVSHGASSGGLLPRVKNLHCTAAYPAPPGELNLYAICSGYDGYSDHSANIQTGALAAACGASIIEVHFKLNNTPRTNPDYMHSLSKVLLGLYIANLRRAEEMLGDGEKKVEKSERWALKHKVQL